MVGPDYDSGGMAAAALEEAMRAIAERDVHETRAALYRRLLDAWLLAITPPTMEDPSAGVFRFSGQLPLVTVAHTDGMVLPAFTSAKRVGEWLPAGGQYVALPARELLTVALDVDASRIHLNPGSQTQGTITRFEIEQLADGRLPDEGHR